MTISLAAIRDADKLQKRGPLGYPCCTCCPDDPAFHQENKPDSHDVPCDVHRDAARDTLAQAIRAVLALHERSTEHDDFDCCTWCVEPWPCATVKAITDAGVSE